MRGYFVSSRPEKPQSCVIAFGDAMSLALSVLTEERGEAEWRLCLYSACTNHNDLDLEAMPKHLNFRDKK